MIRNLPQTSYTSALKLFATRRREIILWIISLTILYITLAPTLRMPIQGDDFFALLNTNQDESVSTLAESSQAFRFALESFINGQTSHFFPSGFFLDVGMKRLMIEAYLFGSSASDVQSIVYLFLGIGTFFSVTFFLSGIFCCLKKDIKPVFFATPIAIGLFVSLQLSTKWSTYDPLVVHPVYGAGVTFIGFFYLAILSRNLSQSVNPTKIVLISLLGIMGVSMYEGFYPFLFSAIVMCLFLYINNKKNKDNMFSWIQSIAVMAPLAVAITSRVYSKVISTSEYGGTDINFSGKTLVSMITSFRTTAPGGMWQRAWNEINLNGYYSRFFIYFGAMLASTLIFSWSAYRKEIVNLDTNNQKNKIKFLYPAILILILLMSGDFLFSLSNQWSDYLMIPGLTYMNALTSYWGWSILIAFLILFTLQKIKSKTYFLIFMVILVFWGNIQFALNTQVAHSELLSPTPFQSDVIRILELDPSLTTQDRCNLFEPFSSNGSLGSNWRENVNMMYQKRFGVSFCDFEPK
jgi:hypothetical protein